MARLIVKEILETKGAIVLEDLSKRAPERMIKNIRDHQLGFEDLPAAKRYVEIRDVTLDFPQLTNVSVQIYGA